MMLFIALTLLVTGVLMVIIAVRNALALLPALFGSGMETWPNLAKKPPAKSFPAPVTENKVFEKLFL